MEYIHILVDMTQYLVTVALVSIYSSRVSFRNSLKGGGAQRKYNVKVGEGGGGTCKEVHAQVATNYECLGGLEPCSPQK